MSNVYDYQTQHTDTFIIDTTYVHVGGVKSKPKRHLQPGRRYVCAHMNTYSFMLTQNQPIQYAVMATRMSTIASYGTYYFMTCIYSRHENMSICIMLA